jgi:hypothetical protein
VRTKEARKAVITGLDEDSAERRLAAAANE